MYIVDSNFSKSLHGRGIFGPFCDGRHPKIGGKVDYGFNNRNVGRMFIDIHNKAAVNLKYVSWQFF